MNIITSENILLIGSFLLISGVLIGKMSYRFGLPLLLLAATMSSTDSASVFGILGSQKVGLKENLRPMLETLYITLKHLENGDTLKDMQLPKGQLVMMVQRNGQHIIPNGTLHLKPNDVLLIIKSGE